MDSTADNRTLWNSGRETLERPLGRSYQLPPGGSRFGTVSDVWSHIFADRPWPAADRTLAPWTETADLDVMQTGASIRSDQRQLSPKLEAFLDAVELPVYFSFGSMRAP
jgi:vancomycin aglycone glucosyltransferase